MRIAGIVHDSVVDGPGIRFVVFAQGCGQECEECHNPESWDPDGGVDMAVEDIINEMWGNPLTDGLTLSGGEPFLQSAACLKIVEAAHEDGLNVWIYTGLTFEELLLRADNDADIKRLLELTDVLVDGPFIFAERTMSLKWRGSRNQRIIDVQKSIISGEPVEISG